MDVDRERHARNLEALRGASHDAWIASSASDVLLMTGYWPVMSNSLAVLTAEGQLCLLVPEDEAELASKTTWVEVSTYKPAALTTLVSPLEILQTHLVALLKALHLENAQIGYATRADFQPASYAVAYHFGCSLREILSTSLPLAQFVAGNDLFDALKAVKTTRELDRIEHGCRVAADGFAEAASCDMLQKRESEVAASIHAAFERSVSAKSLERSYGFFYCMSGPNSAKAAAAFARTRQRVIEQGDMVMVHANTCADGYWTDITRTYIQGEPSTRQKEMQEAIAEARLAGLHSIRPGVTGADVDMAVRAVMKSHGFGDAFKHSTGHAVGFYAANPNGRPRIHPLSPDVLQAGMTFNVGPAAYFDGYGGMRHCDVVTVTNDGVRVLTNF